MQAPDHESLKSRIAELERELAEARLHAATLERSKERLEEFIEFMPQPIFEVDCRGRILYANGRTFELFGYPRQELDTGLNVLQMVAPEVRDEVRESFRKSLTGEVSAQGEYLACRKDGSTFPVIIRTVPFFSEGELRGLRGFIVDISIRKRMEDDLRKSESRYRKLVELLPDALYELRLFREDVTPEERERILAAVEEIKSAREEDRAEVTRRVYGELAPYIEGELILLNQAAERVFGHPFEQMSKVPLTDIIAPELREATLLNTLPILAEEVHRDIEYQVANADGTTIRVSVNARLIGKEYPYIIEGVARDITRQRETEAALRASEQRYRLIYDTVPVSIMEYDIGELIPELDTLRAMNLPDCRGFLDAHPQRMRDMIARVKLIDVNRETLRTYRAASVEGIPGKHTPEAIEAYREAFVAYMERKNHIEYETVNETLDGRHIDVLVRMTLPDDYEFSGKVLLSATDITARKQAERALRASEVKYRSIVEHTNEGIMVTNGVGQIVEWNASAERLTGIPHSEAIGKKFWEMPDLVNFAEQYPPEQQEFSRQTVEDALRTGEETWTGRTMDISLRRADGEVRNIQQTMSVIPAEQGFMLVATVRDVTEHKRLEEERLKTDKLESIGLLAGGIAHDFNNILVSILGNISLARLCTEDSELHEILSGAESATIRARDLTYQLLTFSKGGAPVKKAASISEILRESVGFCLRGTNVRCEYDLPGNLWPVEVDRGQMGQVIHNLVLNAVQAMPDGGTITVGGANLEVGLGKGLPLEPGRYVKIFVRDRGAGISPENIPRLFDPYFTTKETGNGLGLATTWSIIRSHGGHIRAESEVGNGAVFTFYLPVTEARPERKRPSPAPGGGEAGRILVMDDEPGVRDILARLLRLLGHEAETCREGGEALVRYRESWNEGRPFDAVIMDLTVPGGMGGKEAVREMLEFDPGARVIVSSGYSNERIVSDYRDYGFRAVLAKPYQMEELREVLGQVLNPGK